MAHLKMVGSWLYFRNDPAHTGTSGYVPVDKITGMDYIGDGASHVSLYAGNSIFVLENSTLEEVLSVVRSETDRSSLEIVAQQADRIAELEVELAKLRD